MAAQSETTALQRLGIAKILLDACYATRGDLFRYASLKLEVDALYLPPEEHASAVQELSYILGV